MFDIALEPVFVAGQGLQIVAAEYFLAAVGFRSLEGLVVLGFVSGKQGFGRKKIPTPSGRGLG